MNSIDATDKALALVIAARLGSDDIGFDWERWEKDADELMRVTPSDQFLQVYRDAMRYLRPVMDNRGVS